MSPAWICNLILITPDFKAACSAFSTFAVIKVLFSIRVSEKNSQSNEWMQSWMFRYPNLFWFYHEYQTVTISIWMRIVILVVDNQRGLFTDTGYNNIEPCFYWSICIFGIIGLSIVTIRHTLRSISFFSGNILLNNREMWREYCFVLQTLIKESAIRKLVIQNYLRWLWVWYLVLGSNSIHCVNFWYFFFVICQIFESPEFFESTWKYTYCGKFVRATCKQKTNMKKWICMECALSIYFLSVSSRNKYQQFRLIPHFNECNMNLCYFSNENAYIFDVNHTIIVTLLMKKSTEKCVFIWAGMEKLRDSTW